MRSTFNYKEFYDENEEQCSMQESPSKTGYIWFGKDSERMLLSKQMVKRLIPILQYFVDNGELPERRRQ